MIERAKNQIDELISAAYVKAASEGLLPCGVEITGAVRSPRGTAYGDYAATHALTLAKSFKRAPREIAQILADGIDLTESYFKSVDVAGAGFINFELSDKWYFGVLESVEGQGAHYGAADVGKGSKVMVEFVSANPTGPMTIGNARGGVLGDTLAAILDRAGYEVYREFYVNDAGNQVQLFGQSLNARYLQLCFGEETIVFPDNGYHGDDIRELAKMVYDDTGDSLKDLGEEERIKRLVEFALPYNIELMKKHLERYRIKFDNWFRESSLYSDGSVAETVQLLTDNGLTYEKDGAVWLKNTELGADKDEVLRRGNGFYTYYAVDIAYHRNKISRGFEKIIDVWGADHHGHAVRFAHTMSAPVLGIGGDRLSFLIMQMVRLTRDGETVKVSKRTGKALTLNDLLDEISVDACRFFFNAKPDSHLEFDLGLAVRQDSENPVYYVQYAHARICSLISKLTAEGECVPLCSEIDPALLSDPTERELIKQISQLPEEIKQSARDYDPSRINRYVIELAARFHRFYTACRIKGESQDLLRARLKLADTVRITIRNSLEVLGVTAPEKM